jgi:hypothetical protein
MRVILEDGAFMPKRAHIMDAGLAGQAVQE